MNDPGKYEVKFGEFERNLQDAMRWIDEADKVRINDVCKSYIVQLINRIETAHTYREQESKQNTFEEKENKLRDIVYSQVKFALKLALDEQMEKIEKRILYYVMHALMGAAIDDDYQAKIDYEEDE